MEPFVNKFAPRHLAFMREQVWEAKQDISVHDELDRFEFEQIAAYLGNPSIVLEVGCGLGRGSIFLNHLLSNPDILFILGDRAGFTQNSGVFSPVADEFYNDPVLTEDFCRMNGSTRTKILDTEADSWVLSPKADLIFSLCSFGMRVPIERYIDSLIEVAAPGATMIFRTRHHGYGPQSSTDRFASVTYQPGIDSKGVYPVEHWQISRRHKR
jgi:SAM-dependent methyltransferase